MTFYWPLVLGLLLPLCSAASHCEFLCDGLLADTLSGGIGDAENCHYDAIVPERKTLDEIKALSSDESRNGMTFDKIRSAHRRPPDESRVLCLTYTINGSHAKSSSMYNVWGSKHCTRHLLFTDLLPIPGVDPRDAIKAVFNGGEDYYNMWHKVLFMREEILRMQITEEFEWFFFGGDDVMLFVDNLKKFFAEPEVRYMHESGAPLYFGYRHDSAGGNAFHSGAGYVFNAAALHTWETFKIDRDCNYETHSFAEDIFTSICFGRSGTESMDARDEFGNDRFQIFPPAYMLVQALQPKTTPWYEDFRDRPHPRGLDCVSRDAVMWHYVQPSQMPKFHDTVDSKERSGPNQQWRRSRTLNSKHEAGPIQR